MLVRKIERTLIDWKDTPAHKPLIIKGCRQCGKTYSVRSFAESNYKNVVYLNFFSNPDYACSYDGSCLSGGLVCSFPRQIVFAHMIAGRGLSFRM